MSKLVLQMSLSLDGYFEGPGREIDWHRVDEELMAWAIDSLDQADGLIFGRTIYEQMAAYWPTPEALKNDPEVAKRMNALQKHVFSKTLKRVDWQSSTLVKGDLREEVTRLKALPGKDLHIGGSNLAMQVVDLIDEMRFVMAPVLLGRGHTILQGIKERVSLELVSTRVLRSGSVVLVYHQK